MSGQMSLSELAEAAGIPARTIRFYIARGILARPLKVGRGAAYGPEHLHCLDRIKELQARGHSLVEMGHLLEAPAQRSAGLPPPTSVWQYAVADDVMVLVRSGAPPWRVRRIRAALEELAQRLE